MTVSARPGRHTFAEYIQLEEASSTKHELLDGPILNPSVLVEVLSPSTEAYDRGEKLLRYQQIPALRAVALVALSDDAAEPSDG